MGFSLSNDDGPPRAAGLNRCVWMSAGILSYQLCERDMDCDRCPLDAALRHHFARPGTGTAPARGRGDGGAAPDAAPPVERVAGGVSLPADRRYGRQHSWLQTRGHPGAGATSRIGRVGIEPQLAALLMEPHEVVLPGVGEPMAAAGALIWLVTDGGTFPLPSPCAGRVVATNPALAGHPHLLTQDPLGEGWILDLEASEKGLREARLLGARDAEAAWQLDRGRFEAELAAALRSPAAEVGPTLADGGRPLRRLSDMLGAARYFDLVRRAFLRA